MHGLHECDSVKVRKEKGRCRRHAIIIGVGSCMVDFYGDEGRLIVKGAR